ncbi:MAG TPA: MFS transporter [Candidatus Binatia bacterium]|nr:MFS transporter [Candidatus Binatia bacterium]
MFDALRSNTSVRGLGALYGGSLLSGAWTMVIPTIPVLAKHFDVTPGAAAQIVTAMAMGRFTGTPISGVLLDRMGVRAVVVWGAAAVSSAAFLAALMPWLPGLLLLCFLMGMGDSIWALGREVAGVDLARQNQRGRVLSTLHGTHNAGTALCPWLGGLLTERFDFHAAFLAYGIFAALSVLLGFGAPIAKAEHHGAPANVTIVGWSVASIRERVRGFGALFLEIHPGLRSTYIALVVATWASHSYRITLQSMLPLYAGTYLNFTPSQVGLLFSISGAFVFVMIIPSGIIMDKVGRKWATVPSTGLPALAFLLIPFTDSFIQLAMMLSLTGICNGLSLGSMSVSTFDVVPAHARGRLQAARRMIAEMGGTLAPLVGGYLATRFNPGVPFWVYVPILLFAAIYLAVAGRETLER